MKKYLFILLAAMTFVACSDDGDENIVTGKTISPVAEGEIKMDVQEFFENEFAAGGNIYDFPFAINSVEINKPYEVVYKIINSQKELTDLYKGNNRLPDIDFVNHSLLIGFVVGPDGRYALDGVVLQENEKGLSLIVYIQKKNDAGITALITLPFWNLYPKLSEKKLETKVIENNH